MLSICGCEPLSHWQPHGKPTRRSRRRDRHGAVVVPRDAVKKIPAAVGLLIRREAVILEAANAPDFNFEKLKVAIGTQADIILR